MEGIDLLISTRHIRRIDEKQTKVGAMYRAGLTFKMPAAIAK